MQQEKGLDKRGRMTYRTVKNDLIVHNAGAVPVEDLEFGVTPVGSTQFHFDAPGDPVTVHPDSQLSWLLVPTPTWGGNTGNNVQVAATWHEGGEERSGTWTVMLES